MREETLKMSPESQPDGSLHVYSYSLHIDWRQQHRVKGAGIYVVYHLVSFVLCFLLPIGTFKHLEHFFPYPKVRRYKSSNQLHWLRLLQTAVTQWAVKCSCIWLWTAFVTNHKFLSQQFQYLLLNSQHSSPLLLRPSVFRIHYHKNL